MSDIEAVERKIGVRFRNKQLLKEALTHRSFLNENREEATAHNERLEFLGDAVLELIVTELLLARFPQTAEGKLTFLRSALVSGRGLVTAARALGLDEHLLLGRGEVKSTGRARERIIENTYEAVVGAIYNDRGYEAAARFVKTSLFGHLKEIVQNGLDRDAKSRFQECAQEHLGITPIYRTLTEEGPGHEKRFVVGAYVGEELVAQGEGASKKEAEERAAATALHVKGWG